MVMFNLGGASEEPGNGVRIVTDNPHNLCQEG